MDFDPFPVIHLSSIFFVEPPNKATGTKARRIDRKVLLNPFERTTAESDKFREGLSKLWISKVARDTVEMTCLIDMLLCLSFAEITHKTARGKARIDFIGTGENHICRR